MYFFFVYLFSQIEFNDFFSFIVNSLSKLDQKQQLIDCIVNFIFITQAQQNNQTLTQTSNHYKLLNINPSITTPSHAHPHPLSHRRPQQNLRVIQQNSAQSIEHLSKISRSPSKLSKQKAIAKHNYQDLTNMTKQQQRQMVWKSMLSDKKNKKEWTHAYYQGNNKLPHASKTFSVFENKYVQEFPDNNTKYNIQFLQRSLQGGSMKFPRSESGQFKKPSHSLYSKHYRPIVKDTLKFNQDWQLRTSMFGKTWVDHKRDRIINHYHMQMNPFKTPKSNSLISTMSKSQVY